ncbi:hypothetical protein AWB73_05545 [Caballeronia turbans]|jgi:hypothetical protein|nr:hypothetical protein AWB73_05545 [Caballeronia turbans]
MGQRYQYGMHTDLEPAELFFLSQSMRFTERPA